MNGIPDSEPTFRTNVRVYTYDEALSYKLGYENYPDYRGVPKVEIRMRLF